MKITVRLLLSSIHRKYHLLLLVNIRFFVGIFGDAKCDHAGNPNLCRD